MVPGTSAGSAADSGGSIRRRSLRLQPALVVAALAAAALVLFACSAIINAVAPLDQRIAGAPGSLAQVQLVADGFARAEREFRASTESLLGGATTGASYSHVATAQAIEREVEVSVRYAELTDQRSLRRSSGDRTRVYPDRALHEMSMTVFLANEDERSPTDELHRARYLLTQRVYGAYMSAMNRATVGERDVRLLAAELALTSDPEAADRCVAIARRLEAVVEELRVPVAQLQQELGELAGRPPDRGR